MNRKLALASLGLLILSVAGCSSTDYWLVYKHNPNVVPAATYQGFYSSNTGTITDDAIAKCVTIGKGSEVCKKLLTNNSGKRPPLTDSDRAKVLVHYPGGIPKGGLECEIKQTKITRPAYPVYTDDELQSLTDITPSIYLCDLPVTDAGGMRLDYIVRPTEPAPMSSQAEQNQPEGNRPDTSKKPLSSPSPPESLKTMQSMTDQSPATPNETKKPQQPLTKPGSEEIPPEKSTQSTAGTTITIKPAVVNDSIEVHTLYRFRVLIGPVYSSLSQKDREFIAKPHTGGESFVSASVNGNPVNAAVFLKYYWKPRDVYDTKFCLQLDGSRVDKGINCLARVNPIVGLSVSDKPLQNVYVGGSLDILPGLDIVGGAHWSPVETLSGGFVPGQIVPNNTTIPTETRILPGWFVGIAVDTGVAGTWITKATTSLFK